MLTKKMDIVAQTIENQILTVFPEEYVWETFSGKITLRDTILQLLAECCKYAYDNTQETHSLDFYLGGAGSADDSERMMHQRTMNYVRDKRKVQEQQLRAEGWSVNGLTLPEMKGIGEKLKGHRLNHFQFWEICNIHDMRLVKAVVDRKIGKGNFTSQNMQEISDEYDDAFVPFQEDWNGENKEPLFDFLAIFTLEWKYSFDFYYEVAEFMAETDAKRMSDIKNRIGLFSSPKILYSELLLTHPGILPGPMYVENRMVVARRKYIGDIIMADADSFDRIKRQFAEVLVIIGAMLSQMTLEGIRIRDWFIERTDQDDWLSVFKEYDAFQAFRPGKQWNKKKTRCVKDIYNEMSFDYKNHEFRS